MQLEFDRPVARETELSGLCSPLPRTVLQHAEVALPSFISSPRKFHVFSAFLFPVFLRRAGDSASGWDPDEEIECLFPDRSGLKPNVVRSADTEGGAGGR